MSSLLSIYNPRNIAIARKAKRYGMQNSLRTVVEARRAGINVSLGFALVEKESSNGRNVFGHDPTNSIPRSWRGTTVTKAKYLSYRAARKAGKGMQGVGPLQLTWWETQDRADALGGCWKPAINLRVGFSTLAKLIKQYGKAEGIRRYNGSGPRAVEYSRKVRELERKWHNRLK